MGGLPTTLTDAFASKRVFNPADEQVPMESNIHPREAELLNRVVQHIRPEVSVEIGLAHGASALAILQALEDNGTGHHHIIDPYQKKYGSCGVAMIDKANLSHRATFYEAFPEDTVPQLPALDFAFIDGSHLFDLSMLDFLLCNRLLRVGGLVGFHDLQMLAISKLVTYITRNHDYTIFDTIDDKNIYRPKFIKDITDNPIGRTSGEMGFAKVMYFEAHKPIRLWGIGNLIFLQKHSEKSEQYAKLRKF